MFKKLIKNELNLAPGSIYHCWDHEGKYYLCMGLLENHCGIDVIYLCSGVRKFRFNDFRAVVRDRVNMIKEPTRLEETGWYLVRKNVVESVVHYSKESNTFSSKCNQFGQVVNDHHLWEDAEVICRMESKK